MFEWVNYEHKYSHFVDGWLDEKAISMTGIEDGWDDYWQAVQSDAVNFPGCEDFCKIVLEKSVPFAAVCFGIYQNTMTISEFVVDPKLRGKGRGTQLLTDILEIARKHNPNQVKKVTAVVFPQNVASQKAFEKAGFYLDGRTEDGVDLIYTYLL